MLASCSSRAAAPALRRCLAARPAVARRLTTATPAAAPTPTAAPADAAAASAGGPSSGQRAGGVRRFVSGALVGAAVAGGAAFFLVAQVHEANNAALEAEVRALLRDVREVGERQRAAASLEQRVLALEQRVRTQGDAAARDSEQLRAEVRAELDRLRFEQ